jgi:hypothetical protein
MTDDMTDDILEELRECIELIGDAEQESTRRGQPDVSLTREGAHRVVAALAEAAETIGER